jgi:hypothetical protein
MIRIYMYKYIHICMYISDYVDRPCIRMLTYSHIYIQLYIFEVYVCIYMYIYIHCVFHQNLT